MKLLSIVVIFLSFAGSILAQKVEVASSQTDVYDLGTRKVRIPAPDGFVDTMVLYPRIAGRLIASEAPVNEVLAVHVTEDLIPSIKSGAEPDLPFYTKVSIMREAKSMDLDDVTYQGLVGAFEKQWTGALQEMIKPIEKGAGERLKEHWGRDAELKLGETKTFGFFNKQKQVISSLYAINVDIFQRKMTVIGSMSMLQANGRLLFLYVFRIRSPQNDEQLVMDLTEKWTSKVMPQIDSSQRPFFRDIITE